MAKNPFNPGVGDKPPYLADRDMQLARFERMLDDYPEKRRNLRITGLRGVGKTVILKEFEEIARDRGWIVLRRDWSQRLCDEDSFSVAMSEYLREVVSNLKLSKKLGQKLGLAIDGISLQAGVPGVGSAKAGVTRVKHQSNLEDKLRKTLIEIGEAARSAAGNGTATGVILMFDEAHTVEDLKRAKQYSLSSMLSAVVATQDDNEKQYPVMLVLCGLPSLTGNLHSARSNAERMFKSEQLGSLSISRTDNAASEAAKALTLPESEISFDELVSEQIAADVDGYPYFIQFYGEELWDSAFYARKDVVDGDVYSDEAPRLRSKLDLEFFEPRYEDARKSDRKTLRVAASLGGETFTKSDLDELLAMTPNASGQSLHRLVHDNLIYSKEYGVYAYTAPMFGDFVRRCHPKEPDDTVK